ncbi:MAG TPA: cyclic nucleotide-binding domain-containing protein [Leptospiraceae bacterium]|nr:cyclic nucleotide-binding domain-containing protein [Leptospiraceae bacterium]HMY69350.1 cyclic nucleotide-binding domain-containing protein [Leptospiraceae bacterium]HNF13939.1 cyclic nucleotide-binding domain-containing protein [Leptospiraceae bacterium]HNF24413.1 cyclic nucleotide-binding domain-containing protein [Leptospiraceae bacterium]HNH10026.1 cyclic nucleotide-binding domain-containing protein [Leptospiraceae bacterium]
MSRETEWSKLKSMHKGFPAKEVLLAQGDPANQMYILMEGKANVIRNGKLIGSVQKRGEYLGEISFLMNTEYTASVVTETPCTMIRIERNEAESFLRHSPEVAISMAAKLAGRLAELNRKISNLGNTFLNDALLNAVLEEKQDRNRRTASDLNLSSLSSLEAEIPAGLEIIVQNQPLSHLYILLEGEVEIIKNSQLLAIESEPGYYMGDVSVLRKTLPNATVRARTDCRMIQIPAEKLDSFLHHSPEVAISIARKICERILTINNTMEKLIQYADRNGLSETSENISRDTGREIRKIRKTVKLV